MSLWIRVSEDGVTAEAKMKNEILEDGTLLTLKMEKGDTRQRMQTASGSFKSLSSRSHMLYSDLSMQVVMRAPFHKTNKLKCSKCILSIYNVLTGLVPLRVVVKFPLPWP